MDGGQTGSFTLEKTYNVTPGDLYRGSSGVSPRQQAGDTAGGAPVVASSQGVAESFPHIPGGDPSPITNCQPPHRGRTLGIGA
ncbi:MAG TPA: hypothetical protein VKA68_16575 [bacterium]|nr:hypothetical protein [bacterium]